MVALADCVNIMEGSLGRSGSSIDVVMGPAAAICDGGGPNTSPSRDDRRITPSDALFRRSPSAGSQRAGAGADGHQLRRSPVNRISPVMTTHGYFFDCKITVLHRISIISTLFCSGTVLAKTGRFQVQKAFI